jgi:DNA-binding Lrp family transcriptional regulator
MLDACILIKTTPTKIVEILESIKKIRQIEKPYMVSGRWDIVAFVKVNDYRELKELTGEINSLEGVRSTETLASA